MSNDGDEELEGYWTDVRGPVAPRPPRPPRPKGPSAPRRVTIQFQKGYRRDSPWVNAYLSVLLYADRGIILTRGAGAHQTWYGDGRMWCAAYSRRHPASHKFPKKATGWRIHPSSLERIKASL